MTAQLLQLVTIGPWELNGFDVGVLIVLLVSMLYAASRGLVREVTSIASLLFAAFITLFVWGQYRFAAQELIKPAEFADGVLAVGTFLVSYLILALIMAKIGKTITGRKVGFLDRILGASFGVARGLIIAALAVMLWTSKSRASAEAQAYRNSLIEQGTYESTLKNMPKSMQSQLESEPTPLPTVLANSTFYPILDKIGAGLRALPFAKVKTYAERLKDGDIDGLTEELLESKK